MTSPVTKAMLDSYVLMVLVMGMFFLYFCGMVWAFCNPKMTGAEEESETGKKAEEQAGVPWDCTTNHTAPKIRPTCAHVLAPPYTAEELTQPTYVKFWDDSLLSDCMAFGQEDHGIINPNWKSSRHMDSW